MAWRIFRRMLPGRRSRKLFLYTLPITFCPIIFGTLDAILFTIFQNDHYQQTMSAFSFEIESEKWMSSFMPKAVAPGFREWKRPPFQLAPLLNEDWYQTFNLTKLPQDAERGA